MGTANVVALDNATIEIPQGQFVGVVGRSGSGKSTLLHLLAAMDQPTAGTISVGGWDLGRLERKGQARYRREVTGMIFQQFNLIPSMTALENVALPLVLAGRSPAERQARAQASLEAVGLTRRVDHRPTELSGGEQQRVAIARALIHDPPLLLADEPTGNLDAETGAQIIEVLARIHREQGRTIVVVTHQPDDIVDLAERMLELHDGRLSVRTLEHGSIGHAGRSM